MSNTYTPYSQINAMEEFGYIAGSSYTLYFNVYEQDGTTPLDMGGGSFKLLISPYGEEYSILQKDGDITGVGTAEALLETNDTKNLSGKYTIQPVIISFSGQEYRPSQGVVLLIPQIPLE